MIADVGLDQLDIVRTGAALGAWADDPDDAIAESAEMAREERAVLATSPGDQGRL